MADTQVALASRIQKWDADFQSEYVRESGFMPYMGKGSGTNSNPGAVILTRTDLQASGKTINMPFIGRTRGPGVRGNKRLTGAEVALDNYNCPITIKTLRNAHRVSEQEEHWTEMDLRSAMKTGLRNWSAEYLRDDFIISLADVWGYSWAGGQNAALEDDEATIHTPTSIMAALTADQASMDAWLSANRDRVLYGPDTAHMESDFDHSDSVVKLTASTDKASAVVLRTAKQIAKQAGSAEGYFRIKPTRVEESAGREYFVWFVGSADFNNLKQDADIKAANVDARVRDVSSNPIFQDGDLIYDGVIIREIPEVPNFANVGAGGAPVTMSWLCGSQALGLAWGKRPSSRSSTDTDYGHFTGLAITEMRAAKKLIYNTRQTGVVTVFCTAA